MIPDLTNLLGNKDFWTIEFMNLPEKEWLNSKDTAVFMVQPKVIAANPVWWMAIFADNVRKVAPAEYEYCFLRGKVIFRMKWNN